ncbi:hypothetical protein [Lactiplantibacillus modestisalitolerans]|uniref:Alkaline shock response membrane anchor protein AmaP n=1 Tax=Lactiplantibacillus modestisalitolerans TaxID=1457219 RepID=A0ABV5WYE7_9LACO|nr:hypothetical protein [Lactiplantibacillus modestisalitolerans]
MNRMGRLIIGGAGGVLVLLALVEVSQSQDVFFVTEWLASLALAHAHWFNELVLVIAIIVGLIGLCLLVLSLLKPRQVVALMHHFAPVRVPVSHRIVESDLQYRLTAKLRLINPQVRLKLRYPLPTRVSVQATAEALTDVELVTQQVQDLITDYLCQELPIRHVHPLVKVTPLTQPLKIRPTQEIQKGS